MSCNFELLELCDIELLFSDGTLATVLVLRTWPSLRRTTCVRVMTSLPNRKPKIFEVRLESVTPVIGGCDWTWARTLLTEMTNGWFLRLSWVPVSKDVLPSGPFEVGIDLIGCVLSDLKVATNLLLDIEEVRCYQQVVSLWIWMTI